MLDLQMSEADLQKASEAAARAKVQLMDQLQRMRQAPPNQTQDAIANIRRVMTNHIKTMERRQMERTRHLQAHRTTMKTGPARTVDHK